MKPWKRLLGPVALLLFSWTAWTSYRGEQVAMAVCYALLALLYLLEILGVVDPRRSFVRDRGDPFGRPGPDSVTVLVRCTGKVKVTAVRALRAAVPGLRAGDASALVEIASRVDGVILTRAATAEQAAALRKALAAAGAGIEAVVLVESREGEEVAS